MAAEDFCCGRAWNLFGRFPSRPVKIWLLLGGSWPWHVTPLGCHTHRGLGPEAVRSVWVTQLWGAPFREKRGQKQTVPQETVDTVHTNTGPAVKGQPPLFPLTRRGRDSSLGLPLALGLGCQCAPGGGVRRVGTEGAHRSGSCLS